MTKALAVAAGLLFAALTSPMAAHAAGAVNSGEYVVQYSAVNSLQIPQSVADANGITRSGDTALVMITLQKPSADSPVNAVAADVNGRARNLMGDTRVLDFRRVEAANSVYSLAELPIRNDETVSFDLEVEAVDGRATVPVRFNQTFFTR